MGKATGFLEYKRALPPDRQPFDRIRDWQEFRSEWPEEDARCQGARCMDCGIPYCHMGLMIAGAAAGCPINNLIPEFNDLIYRGLWKQAMDRLMKTNNFPEFTGRVCPAPCEGSCTVGLNGDAVTIKLNECSIIDKAWEMGWMKPKPPAVRTGKRVAVVGSGPAGLACADQLNHAGHQVTIYERADRAGGLLMYGIPNMKLDKSVVIRRLNLMRDEGVTFITNCEVGLDISLSQLKDDNDAVVLCGGATRPRDLPIEGRELDGVHFAMDFLRANTQALLDHQNQIGKPDSLPDKSQQTATVSHNPAISATDKDVIVIGGGDTGTDCVGTAIRQGCRSVTQLEIMPCPAATRAENNPWPQWPKILKTDYGQQEAIALQGEDPRVYLTTATRFRSDENNGLAAVETVEIEWQKDEQGRMMPVPRKETAKTRPAQLVLLAMGFLGPDDTVLNELPIKRDGRSNVETVTAPYQTNIPGVFAAGDMRRGQSLVVWAIDEGRKAARACDIWLTGSSQLPDGVS